MIYANIFSHANKRCLLEIKAEREEFLEKVVTLDDAIQTACKSKITIDRISIMHSHQRRVGAKNLEKAEIVLKSAANEIRGSNSFDSLHDFVRRVTKNCNRIGDLAVYDICERIGWYLELEPEEIYLHAGTKIGAEKLLKTKLGKVISKDKLPTEFQIYTPSEIETLLCVYKDYWDCPEKFANTIGTCNVNKRIGSC